MISEALLLAQHYHCFLDRYKEYFTSADNQFGFKKGVSCNFAIYTVRQIVDKFVDGGCTVNLCSIDLSKVFDKVNHCALKRQLPVRLLCTRKFAYRVLLLCKVE